MRLAGDLLEHRLNQPRFTDTGLCTDQRDAPASGLRLPPAAEQKIDLLIATDNWSCAGMQRLEPADPGRAAFSLKPFVHSLHD